MRWNWLSVLVAGGAFLAVWSGLGQIGYRAGQLVTLGPAVFDPELLRGLLAALASLIAGSVAKLPIIEHLRQMLIQLGLSSPLSVAEQRDLYDRVQRIDESVTDRADSA
jgi:hypothetical protein